MNGLQTQQGANVQAALTASMCYWSSNDFSRSNELAMQNGRFITRSLDMNQKSILSPSEKPIGLPAGLIPG